MRIAVVLAVFAAFVVAASWAAPSPPHWPKEFKTAFEFTTTDNRSSNIGDWEYSQEFQSERWNHNFPNGTGTITVIRRYDVGKQWFVRRFYKQTPTCLSAPLKGSLFDPDFSSFKYIGQAKVGEATLDKWSNASYLYEDYEHTESPYELYDKRDTASLVFRKFRPMHPPRNVFFPPKECNSTTEFHGSRQSGLDGCSFLDKLKCAAVVALCAAACCVGGCVIDPGCIACMGGAWNDCKGCF